MSEGQLKAFIEKVKGNTTLQEKLKAAADADAVLAIAKEAGFSISADDLKKAQSELSDKELESAAGGGDITWDFVSTLVTACADRTMHCCKK
ncbi:Nitrogen fixation protein of unknown function [Synechococcus sp. MIT S9509]|uniref:Nif11-like leader peptide family natural product precursor n=1 Tax=unclassified Synechococcus TaxID=2626047 RepID=UPI0007BC7444|nr:MULTISPECIES: Nif11-like leader peptide family natural product precursor [unclassified Synechococcus]KZR88090.1 Nitrogen fixation protein of unknown function [Synechococcus sp. MIT S9504]KZR92125.1 Nitrogen fixation protein of unknown function [Synechococcus sp. MIT S9509]